MKKSAILLAGVLLLAIPVGGKSLAQDTNLLGLYVDEQMSDNNLIVEDVGLVPVYVVLSHPVNPNFNGSGDPRDVDRVGGFECGFVLDSADFIVDSEFPMDHVNIGDLYEMIVGFATPYLVVGDDRAVTLVTLTIFTLAELNSYIYLRPIDAPSIPGQMAYLDGEDDYSTWVVPMGPASGSWDIPVFSINGGVVAMENASWGSVKSLYR